MLDRSRKRVGHGSEKEVGDGRGIRRRRNRESINLLGRHVRVSDNVHMYHSNSQLTA